MQKDFKRLLYGYGFCKVSRFIYIAIPLDCHIIGQQLKRDNRQRCRKALRAGWQADDPLTN